MNNVQICHRCLANVVYRHDGTRIAVGAINADGVDLIKKHLSAFTPSVSYFYMSLKKTSATLNQKSRVATQAIDEMRADAYPDLAIQHGEKLFGTIRNNLSVVEYMTVFIEMHFKDEVSVLQASMPFSELEGILND